jgi:hypothetical protein
VAVKGSLPYHIDLTEKSRTKKENKKGEQSYLRRKNIFIEMC